MIGIDHVGLGSDFNHGGGVTGYTSVGDAPNVTRELLKRGYSEEDLLIGSIAVFGFSLAFRPTQTDDEPQTKVELGRQLFFDPILSSDRTISCSSCHKPEFAFADTSTGSRGVGGQLGDRNTPSAMNLTGRIHLFWDGQVGSSAYHFQPL